MVPEWHWRDRFEGVSVFFGGKGLPAAKAEALRHITDPTLERAWVRQIHSSRVVEAWRAAEGERGEGDALITRAAGLALAVVTADCVPVLATDGSRIAAIHAGWRGVAGRIVQAALEPWPSPPRVAWIGPAIGGDVYEVGEEVAERVVEASHPQFCRPGARDRPHVDLGGAVAWQLAQLGVREIRRSPLCTLSTPELWSWRRDGAAAGRNYAVIYRRNSEESSSGRTAD